MINLFMYGISLEVLVSSDVVDMSSDRHGRHVIQCACKRKTVVIVNLDVNLTFFDHKTHAWNVKAKSLYHHRTRKNTFSIVPFFVSRIFESV